MKNQTNLLICIFLALFIFLACAAPKNENKPENKSENKTIENKNQAVISNQNANESKPQNTNAIANTENKPQEKTQTKEWNPQEGCEYLATVDGLKSRGYKESIEAGKYTCSSDYKKLGGDMPLPNTIAYYANGDTKTLTELKLVLNVNVKAKGAEAQKSLAEIAETLTTKATDNKMPAEAQKGIIDGKSGQWSVGNIKLEVKREDWATGKGYEIQYIIHR